MIVAGLRAADTPASLAAVARTVELDITSGHDLEDFLTGLPALDVLANAAGVLHRGEEYRPEVFARVVEVNLTGTMRACVSAKPLLCRGGGCIVNVASMLSFSAAMAWAAEGIRVNAVAPGWIRTSLTAGLHENAETFQRIVDRTPMGRWGEPAAVAFLCRPDARFITSVVLPVDGGYLAA